MRKMVTCEHCGGQKTCTVSGGRSCIDCLRAAGRGRRSYAAVRCSFCGGRGFVFVEEEEGDEADEATDDEATEDEE